MHPFDGNIEIDLYPNAQIGSHGRRGVSERFFRRIREGRMAGNCIYEPAEGKTIYSNTQKITKSSQHEIGEKTHEEPPSQRHHRI
jgi:hypothetical protein